MGLDEILVWACSLAGLFCNTASVPDVSIVQSAYEQEERRGSPLHDKNLRVLKVECGDRQSNTFLCQVAFLSNDDPQQRLYFDVIAIARNDRGWELKSGLCKH